MRHFHIKSLCEIFVKNTSDGRTYTGDWVEGKRQGFGVMSYPQNDTLERKEYVGEWMQNEREGQGTMKWKNENWVYFYYLYLF